MDARENRFLEGFSPGGRERLISHLVYQDLGAGEYLFREGDSAEGVCLVLEGRVEIVKTPGPNEQILEVVEPGDYLGEVAVLDGHGRSTDARTKGAASLAWIPTSDLLKVLITEPVTVTLQLFQNVLALLRKTDDLYVQERVRKEKLSLIGEMAGSLMHDLRSPVQVILSAIDVMRINHSDPETLDCCAKMENQCDRLVAMAGELLEFSKGETKLHLQRTDTSTLMRQFLAFNEDTFRPVGVTLHVEDEPAEIEVDSMRVQRVLQNLVANAGEALKSRQQDGRIDVRAWVADSILYLSVRDNGPGIPAEIRDRIFDPFVSHGKSGGTGLGLAIVNNVVTAHRGKIAFETQAGQGTEFQIRLPQDSASKPVG
ncbi:MAG: ATP-binding protein [Methylacidiphilales bacterium]|nr:ATP-binding protein [Candidatus Methylacidiphilales bacterium]